MSIVEASITIKVPDGVDPEPYITMIETIVSQTNGKETEIHLSEMDDPLTTNPIGPR